MLTQTELDVLHQCMCDDSIFGINREAFDKLIDSCNQVSFKPKQPIVEQGVLSSDVWIVAKGVCRLAYFNDANEVTYGFGSVGSMFLSPYGVIARKPALYYLISVTETILLQISWESFRRLITTDLEISNWFCGNMLCQFQMCESHLEWKNLPAAKRVEQFMNGALERQYNFVNPNMKNYRRHLLPMNVLASYLGMTRSHMHHLIKKIYQSGKE